MDKGTAALLFTIGCFVVAVVSAVFNYPTWATWRKEQKTERQKRGEGASAPPRWILFGTASLILFVASAVFAEVWLYFWLHQPHPSIYRVAAIAPALVLLGLWWIVTRNASALFEDARALRAAAVSLKEQHNLELSRIVIQHKSELLRAEEVGRQFKEEKREASNEVRILKDKLAEEQRGFGQMVLKKDQECSDRVIAEREKLNKKYAEALEQLNRQHLEDTVKLQTTSPRALQTSTPTFPTISALYNQTPPKDLSLREYFRTAYFSPVTAEAEHNIKIAANNDSPNDREAFYTRLVGIGVIAYLHDEAWWGIFKSQILLLMELNRLSAIVSLSVAQKIYDDAVPLYPDVYPAYTFERWLGWLKDKAMVIVYPSNMLEITHRGKDFLKYNAHWSRSPDEKKY